jgi:hypothetical protein
VTGGAVLIEVTGEGGEHRRVAVAVPDEAIRAELVGM